jgi:uncharacterized protein (TIGR02391 family)
VDSEQARKLLDLAQSLQGAVSDAPAPAAAELPDPLALFDLIIRDAELIDEVRQLFADGHYSQAVEEGFKYLNNVVKRRTGLTADGASLMTGAFSPGSPVLKLSALKSLSQKDQQQGYMRIYEGVMIGIRNPRAHDHKHKDDSHSALELLAFCNHLVRVAKAATRARKRKT